jgi:hypothetical protein
LVGDKPEISFREFKTPVIAIVLRAGHDGLPFMIRTTTISLLREDCIDFFSKKRWLKNIHR